MRRLLLAFPILAACHHAPASPPPVGNGSGSAPAPTTCADDTAPLFTETRHDLHANPPPNQPPSYALVIHDSGKWTLEGEPAGSGCLGAGELASLQQRLAAATFATIRPQVHCMTVPILHADYASPGKSDLALETPCGVTTTDDSTRAAIACAEALVSGQACE